jgi:hypothetical protein
MKRILLLVLLGLAASSFFAGVVSAGSVNAPEAEIIITGEKKSARFSHPVHLKLGVECGQCHHDSGHNPLTDSSIEAMENSESLRCATCHNKDFSNAGLQSIKDAFHQRCKECHKQGVNGIKGPTKCKDCHVK